MKHVKRLLIVILILFIPVHYASAIFFTDVDNHWGEEYIYWATLDVPVFSGYQDGSFRPNRSISRAEFITMIRKVLEAAGQGSSITVSSRLAFNDLSEHHWAYQHIQFVDAYLRTADQTDLLMAEIFTDQRLLPDLPITRREVALLTHSITTPPARDNTSTVQFTDIPGTDPHYRRIRELADNGLVSGYEDGTFRPNRFLTRAEAAVMAQKIFSDLEFLSPNRLTITYPLIQYIYRYPTFDMPSNRRDYSSMDRRMDRAIATLEYRAIMGFIPRDEQDLYDASPIETLWKLKNADYSALIATNYYLLTYDSALVSERKKELAAAALDAYLSRDDARLEGFLLLVQRVKPYATSDQMERALKRHLTARLTFAERIETTIRLAEVLSAQAKTSEALALFPPLLKETNDYEVKLLLIRNEIVIRHTYLGVSNAIERLRYYWNNIVNEPRYWFYEEYVEREFTALMKQLLIQK